MRMICLIWFEQSPAGILIWSIGNPDYFGFCLINPQSKLHAAKNQDMHSCVKILVLPSMSVCFLRCFLIHLEVSFFDRFG
jgi:hypothetical protein